MNKNKRALSFVLAILMVLSSLSAGIYAIAAETAGAEDSAKDSAVQEVEDAIASFCASDYASALFSTKAADADKKAQAEKEFTAINAKFVPLTEAQRTEMQLSYYVYWLGINAQYVGVAAGKTSAAAKEYGATTGFDDVVKSMGALPAEYQVAYDAMRAFYIKIGKALFNSTFDFRKNTAGYAHFEKSWSTISSFTQNQMAFANYCYPSGSGFYFYSNKPTDNKTYLIENLIPISFNYYQDKESATGAAPKEPSYSTYIQSTRNPDKTYTYTWKSGKNTTVWLEDYKNYFAQMQTDVFAPAQHAAAKLTEILGAVYGPEFSDALTAVLSTGMAYYETDKITVDEINAVISKINALSGNSAEAFEKVIADSRLKVDGKFIIGTDWNEDTSAADAYSSYRQNKVETKKPKDLLQDLKDVLSQLQADEFKAYIESVDLNNLNADVIGKAQQLWSALPSAFQNATDPETYTKFMKIVKPAPSDYTFEKEIKAFQTTPIDRNAIGGRVVKSKGGIQSAAYNLYNMLANSILPLISKDIDLSNGLDQVLEDNLYQIDIVEAIFDLYSTLSHNATETGVGIAPTLGDVVKLLISDSTVKSCLVQDDNKFAGAIEKISKISLTAEEKAEGINGLDKLAEIEFTAADFGFKAGDRDGFIDALLAALRPITLILAGDNSILGVAKVYINMFDAVDANGNYAVGGSGKYDKNGIYAMLLPMLEELGLNVPTAEDYRLNYYTVRNTMGKNLGYDEVLRPIINALFTDVVDPVSADPLGGLLTVLPRIAHVIEADMITSTLKEVIAATGDTLSGLAGGLDLSADVINAKIAGISIDLSSTVNDGETHVITLKPIDWTALSHCATVESKASNSNDNAYFMFRTGDFDSAFTQLFYYIYSVAIADYDNYATIKAVAGNLGSLSSAVTTILASLKSDGVYKAYGRVLAIFGSATGGSAEVVDPDKGLGKVKGFKVTGRGEAGTALWLDFNDVSSATEYRFYDVTDNVLTYLGTSSTSDFKFTGLKPAWEYDIKVVASNNGNPVAFGTYRICAATAPVENLVAGRSDANTISVSWDYAVCHGYYIQWSTTSDFSSDVHGQYINGTFNTSFKFNAEAGKDYFVRVRSWKNYQGSYVYSDFSNGVNANMPLPASDIKVTGRGNAGTSIWLDWSDVYGAVSYDVYEVFDSEDSENPELHHFASSETSDVNINNLEASSFYKLCIVATDADGKTSAAYFNALTAGAPVEDVKAVEGDGTSYVVSWLAADSAQGYYVQWSADPNFAKGATNGAFITGAKNSHYTVDANGAECYVRVRAYSLDDNGAKVYSDFSDAITIH